MAHVSIKLPGAPEQEAELAPGCHRLGRSLNTDLQLSDPSVSSAHCELTVSEGAWLVKDLGSTNGTFIEGKQIKEGQLEAGQTLKLGQVEIVRTGAGVGAPPVMPEAFSETGRIEPSGGPTVQRVSRLTVPGKVRARKNFYRTIPGAFAYPFKGNGWGLLLGGTLVFGLIEWFYTVRVGGIKVVGFTGLMIIPLTMIGSGYVFLFMQSVVTLTSVGEDEMSSWPDFENLWDSGFRPFGQLFAVIFVSMLPAIAYGYFADDPEPWIVNTLICVGLFYLPMSLLAVSIYDSVFALNPMLTFPAIAKAPGPYVVCCLILCGLWFARVLLDHLMGAVISNQLAPALLSEFVFLYTMCVVMRLLGLLYWTKKKEFGWKLVG